MYSPMKRPATTTPKRHRLADPQVLSEILSLAETYGQSHNSRENGTYELTWILGKSTPSQHRPPQFGSWRPRWTAAGPGVRPATTQPKKQRRRRKRINLENRPTLEELHRGLPRQQCGHV